MDTATVNMASPPAKSGKTVCVFRQILDYAIAAVMLVHCNTVWITLASLRGWLPQTLQWLLLIFVVMRCLLTVHRPTKRELWKSIATVGGMAAYLAILYFVIKTNKDVYFAFAWVLLLLTVYCLFCYEGGAWQVLLKYRTLLCGVAVYSLVMWLFCSVLKVFPPSGEEWTSWTDASIGYAPIQSWAGIYFAPQGIRNTSIFTEGPMAALQYSLALLIEAFLVEKPKIPVLAILAVALCTTMTTTGYLVLLYIALCYLLKWLYRRGWLQTRAGKISLISITVVGVIAAAVILARKLDTVSGSIRFDDMQAGWRAFLDAPIFGNGCNNLPAIQQYMSEWRRFNIGYSSGLLWVLSDGGLWLGAVYLCPVVMAVVQGIRRRAPGVVAFALCLVGIFLISVFQYSYLLSLLSVFLLFWRPKAA